MASSNHTTPALAAADGGKQYRAKWTNAAGQAISQAASVTVAVPPAIVTHPASVSRLGGQTATFSASASGNPPPSVQWQVSTNGGSTWSNVGGATGGSYTTPSLTTGYDGYQYRAVFTNAAGSATTNAATLTVSTVPAITGNPSSATRTTGQSVSFSASASGYPSPTVQWQVSTNGGSTWGNISGATSTTYTFTTASGENGYQYRAVFTNRAGSTATSAATLTVEFPVGITAAPVSTTVVDGDYATLSVAATGNPAPTYQWRISTDGWTYADIPGATAASYTTPALSGPGTVRYYRVVVSNKFGSVTPTGDTSTGAGPTTAAWVVAEVLATGGTVTTYYQGSTYYRLHSFIGVGTSALNCTTANNSVEYVVIGGGGGGGARHDRDTDVGIAVNNCTASHSALDGGGGGAGGLLEGSTTLPSGATSVTVGAGGVGGRGNTNGGDSSLGSIVAYGGGAGSSHWDGRYNGSNGGSGGGCTWGGLQAYNSASTTVAGTGVSGQGYSGGKCTFNINSANCNIRYGMIAGGGGGALGPGNSPVNSASLTDGGPGKTIYITGVARAVAGGGAGGHTNTSRFQAGGSLVGGRGGNCCLSAGAGVSATGGGGGGGSRSGQVTYNASKDGGAGGSGAVYVRYVARKP